MTANNDEITQSISSSLRDSIQTQIDSTNLGISNNKSLEIATKVANDIAAETAASVSQQINKELLDIPKNIIGINNPVDLVSGKTTTESLTKNLTGKLTSKLFGKLNFNTATKLQSELIQNLPADKRTALDFEQLAESLAPATNNSIISSLTSFVKNLFRVKKVDKKTGDNETAFAAAAAKNEDRKTAVEKTNETYIDKAAEEQLSISERFDIENDVNAQKLLAVSRGFIDPEANYPREEYDVNKLARGDVRNTVVQRKNIRRMTGAKLPGDNSWDQPLSPYLATYPYNKITQTERGHIIEIDDTSGAERLHVYHRSGTFIEIDSNGSVVKRTTGSSYEIIDRNGKIAINGKADISINGSCNIFVGNDANIEVDGDTNITCHNDITAQAGGNLMLSAAEEVNITGTKVNIEALDVLNMYSNTSLNAHVQGDLNLRANADMYFFADDLYTLTTNWYIEAINKIHEIAGDSKYTDVGKILSIRAIQAINMDAALINQNAGLSIQPDPSKVASIADRSNIGILDGRKDIDPVNIEDPVALTLSDPFALKNEEDIDSIDDYDNHVDLIVTSGLATREQFDAVPYVIETSSDQSKQSRQIAASDTLLSKNQLPGNYNLSPSITLEMLTSKAGLTKCFITPVSDEYTYGRIVYNLQQIALNILEPAINFYPHLVIASGYRTKELSSPNSEHHTGQCVDIQFLGSKPSDYFTIAKRLARVLNYDQLILEYTNYTSSPWIHISYKGESNRKQVMTFWNNKKHSDGLSKLA